MYFSNFTIGFYVDILTEEKTLMGHRFWIRTRIVQVEGYQVELCTFEN